MVNLRQQSQVINKKKTNFRYCQSLLFAQFASGNIENALEEFLHNYFDYLTRLQLITVDLL